MGCPGADRSSALGRLISARGSFFADIADLRRVGRGVSGLLTRTLTPHLVGSREPVRPCRVRLPLCPERRHPLSVAACLSRATGRILSRMGSNRSSRGAEQMSDLVVIAFPTEAKAEEVRQKLLAMQKEYLIELGDAVIAVKDSNGNIKLNQLINTTAAGAATGAFWGTLIGLIFLMPLAGAALGVASGTLSGYLTDVGINDKWMKETAAAVQPGTAALFVLVRKVTADKVLDRLKGEGGTVLKLSLIHI